MTPIVVVVAAPPVGIPLQNPLKTADVDVSNMSANEKASGRASEINCTVETAEASYAWYAIHTNHREEYRAREHLCRQGYEVFLPVLYRERLTAGKKIVAKDPLFARYLFVSLSQTVSNWYSIRSTRGVQRIVEFGQRPVPVPDELML